MRTFQDFITEARKKVKIEVNPKKPIEYKIADIGPGKKEYNVKTSKGWTNEAYDKEVMSGSQIRTMGAGGRISAERKKSEPERRRTKRVGGGQTAPSTYKPRKDIGQQKTASERQQQPEQERGSARERQLAAAKEERRKAALARRASRTGGETPAPKPKAKAKELESQATKLLSKGTAKKAKAEPSDDRFSSSRNPEDHMIKGKYTKDEKKKLVRAGKRLHRDIVKGIDKPASHYQP